MSERKLRVGVAGASFGAAVHVPAYRAQGRFEVVALASPSSAARVAREREIPHAFSSVDEMLDAVELDVVSVASPPFAHHHDVLAALARGKHVLCEKPFALDVAEAEELVVAAQRAGTVCALAHEFRYTPARSAVRELIENGHLGPLREIEVTFLGGMLRASGTRPNSWWFERARGGGLTGAFASHLVDLSTYLAGRAPLRATGFERTANPRRTAGGVTFTSDVADGAFALIDYGAGLIGRVTADGTRAVSALTVAAHGELRSVASTGADLVAATTFTIDEEETAELELRPAAHAILASVHPNLPPFVSLLDEFANAIDGKPAAYPTFADGLATQRVLAAIGYGAACAP
jgi:predicted dehydrogenase